MRELYGRHGYSEVITPQVFDRELFETSGHLPEYAENMFFAATRESMEHSAEVLAKKGALQGVMDAPAIQRELEAGMRFGIKPMNCPGHCVMFGMTRRSYRELPMRLADFGRLHRFERSGVVQGLTRVRTFSQDDAHIFCTLEQVQGEMSRSSTSCTTSIRTSALPRSASKSPPARPPAWARTRSGTNPKSADQRRRAPQAPVRDRRRRGRLFGRRSSST